MAGRLAAEELRGFECGPLAVVQRTENTHHCIGRNPNQASAYKIAVQSAKMMRLRAMTAPAPRPGLSCCREIVSAPRGCRGTSVIWGSRGKSRGESWDVLASVTEAVSALGEPAPGKKPSRTVLIEGKSFGATGSNGITDGSSRPNFFANSVGER